MQPDRGRDLDGELRDLGPRVEYPPVPDIAGSVRGRLDAEAGGSGSPARSGPQLWWFAAAAVALLIAIPAFSLTMQGMGGGGMSAGGGGGEAGSVDQGSNSGSDADNESRTVPLLEEQEDGPSGGAEPTQPSLAMDSGASGSAGSGSSAAACATPEPILEARPARGAAGDEFGIRGRYFDGDLRDCDNDPARDVRVEFLQDGRRWELGRLASDEDSRLVARLEVPADAKPGRATVRATYGQGPPGNPYGQTTTEAGFFVLE